MDGSNINPYMNASINRSTTIMGRTDWTRWEGESYKNNNMLKSKPPRTALKSKTETGTEIIKERIILEPVLKINIF